MNQTVSAADEAKKASAARALEFVEDGMKLGLGTGSTAAWLVRMLGAKVRAGGFDVLCVPTSSRTRDLAIECGIKVATLDQAEHLDLTIDGADEFDPALNLVKGGGGALLQEKIVAAASDRMVVIADPTKAVDTLGAFPLPVEIVRFGWEVTRGHVERLLAEMDVSGHQCTLRTSRDVAYVTDEGHHIIDLHLQQIGDPPRLAAALNAIPGVVESGLFIGLANGVVVGREDGTASLIEAKKMTKNRTTADANDDLFSDLA